MENVNEVYACCYKEVLTILCMLPEEDWNKIPKAKKDFYFECMDKNHKFEIDPSKPISELKVLRPTKAILANIFKNYLAIPSEKQAILIKEKEESQKIEEEKRKKYNPNEIFKNINNKKNISKKEVTLPVEVRKENFFEKIINRIKKILKKDS